MINIDWHYLEGLKIHSISKGIPSVKVYFGDPHLFIIERYKSIKDMHEVCVYCERYFTKELISNHVCFLCNGILGKERDQIEQEVKRLYG